MKPKFGLADARQWPAAFGRLCVETNPSLKIPAKKIQPPSGGCVLKPSTPEEIEQTLASRLRAAVC